MKIIKASAGSGKTHTLSHTYIKWLLDAHDPRAYRHMLAVTFTNKATAEMKARILKDLAAEAQANEDAKLLLVNILHDYGAFGVSTIDRFFQQTLRAFCRELGQHSSYQVELDKEALIKEAMDRVLDGLTSDKKDLVAWLRSNAYEQLDRKGYFHLDNGLLDMGKRLKSEDFRLLLKSSGIDGKEAFSKERLAGLHRRCSKIVADFEKDAAAAGYKKDNKKGYVARPTTQKAIASPDVDKFFGKAYDVYTTARLIDKAIYGLGLAREFNAEFDALLTEKNVLPLDESNTLLRDIIDGSDAPFVYEKTGTRYAHYLLDEFQDTSRLQWDNFLPLLLDADAAGENLIVGDVKQSIYRFRNSDWRLLGYEVGQAFPKAEVKPLEQNWRSAAQIVDFNGAFFKYAASELGCTELYDHVHQEVATKDDQGGYVHVRFTKEKDQESAVLEAVASVLAAGALPDDIAILVRWKAEGAKVAKALIDNGYSVISDDSLDLKGSVTVKRLISLLKYYDNPSDSAGSYLAGSLDITFPDSYHSLTDFCESLLRDLRDFDPQSFEAETLFTGSFMDMLREWTETNGNNLKAFLDEWDQKRDLFIGSPENTGSIRVLTIHKSKGLEFPCVIFPYADEVKIYKDEMRWCRLDCSGTPLEGVGDGIYPVNLSSIAGFSLFAEDYRQEYRMQTVDNLNVFYVALTRAVKSLYIIAHSVADGKLKNLRAGKAVQWSFLSELLYKWLAAYPYPQEADFSRGVPYDFSRMARKEEEMGKAFPSGYPSIPLGGRLRASADASDFFGPDGTTGPEASVRLRGIELHAILSCADTPADLPADMDEEGRKLLTQRMSAHPEWFPGAGARNEQTIFAPDGSRYRPDRIVSLPGGGTAIIDYKFGAARDAYIWQVRRYVNLCRQIGYKGVRGYVWYIPEDIIVEV